VTVVIDTKDPTVSTANRDPSVLTHPIRPPPLLADRIGLGSKAGMVRCDACTYVPRDTAACTYVPRDTAAISSHPPVLIFLCTREPQGYGATLASFGPFSAIYFLCYERLKAAHIQYREKQIESARGWRSDKAGALHQSAQIDMDSRTRGSSGACGRSQDIEASSQDIQASPTSQDTRPSEGAGRVGGGYALLHGAAAGALASFLTNGPGVYFLNLKNAHFPSIRFPLK